MNLDPSVSPWPGVIASVAVCLWIAAIGALLAYAVFRDRPRLVWPFYAPVVGVAVVLLVTNLAAYVAPGAPAAWVGLIGPSALGVVVVWRGGALRPLPRGSRAALLAMALVAVGVFALAYANRLHRHLSDETWHYGLAHGLARGVFPPVTPYGVDASPGYHYGIDLLAASIMNTASVLPWTAFDALATFLVVGLILAVVGFAYDVGAPLALALGIGATVGFSEWSLLFGYHTGYVEGLAFLEPSAQLAPAFAWLRWPQRPLAVCIVLLLAAVLHAGASRRKAALLAAGAGVFALGDASVALFASAALALVGTVRLVRLRGRERLAPAAALVASALLVALAGGPVSDALFGRGGTAGMVRVAWEPDARELLPFQQAGPALVEVGLIPLVAIGALAAYRRRSWGLSFLAAAGAFGLLEAELLHAPVAYNDQRVVEIAGAVAIVGALSGLGATVGALPATGSRILGTAALALLVFLPTGLPRAVSGAHLALRDLEVANPAADDTGHHYRDRTRFGQGLEEGWEFYAWLQRSLPPEARLLTPYPNVSASAAGIGSPKSGRDRQLFSDSATTPAYEEGLRFLNCDDLAEMGITHLHVTEAVAAGLTPAAKRLLDNPAHFALLADLRDDSGERHRLFAVLPGAGVCEEAPSSYRALHQIVPPNAPVAIVGAVPEFHRRMIFSVFADHDDLGSLSPAFYDRATRIPRVRKLTGPPDRGVVISTEPLEPIALGVSRDESLWTGHGMRAYDLAAAWSPVWRIGRDPAALPGPARSVCEAAADGQVDLHLLGEPGTRVTAGPAELTLTGLPQIVQLTVPDCGGLTLSADATVTPFAQIRPHHSGGPVDRGAPIAGLGFDGGVDGGRAVVGLWYRNPHGVPFVTGTEFRVYETSPLGIGLHPDNPNTRTASIRWWPRPIALHPPEQTARIEFDARRLEINGDPGAGSATNLTPGRTYLLALNIAGVNPTKGSLEIQHIIPLARVVVSETGVDYEVLSGIVTIEHHAPGTSR